MYGLLGSDNICLWYNYMNIWNLRVQKNLNIEKIAFIFRIVHLLLTFIESYYNFLSSDLYKNDTFQEIYFHLLKVFF